MEHRYYWKLQLHTVYNTVAFRKQENTVDINEKQLFSMLNKISTSATAEVTQPKYRT